MIGIEVMKKGFVDERMCRESRDGRRR